MTQARVELLADSRQVRRATNDLKQLEARGESTTRVVGGLGRAFVALGGAAVLGKAIREIASFQAALNGLAAVSGATTEQMAQLEQQARTLGATSMFSAQQAAEGQRFLAQAGFQVNEILSATPGILKLATAGGLDLARAADIASNVLGGMRLEVEELNRVNDVLAATAARSNTSIEQLGQALSFAAPFAAAAGISIEEASAAIGVMSDAGIQASRAGTGLVGVIRQLSKVTTEGERVLNKYGLTTEDVNIEARGLLPVLESLRRANLSTGDAIALFGSEAGAAAQVLVQGFKGGIEGATGEADRMARQLEQGLIPAFKSLISAVSESTLQLGSGGIAGALEDLIRSATGVISVWNGMGEEWAESNDVGEEMLGTIEGIADGLEFMGKAAVAVVGARLAGSLAVTATSFAAAQVQAVRYQAALASMAGVSRTTAVALTAMGTAARGASAAMAFLGGPVGVALLAAGAIAYFALQSDEAIKPTRDLAAEVANLGTEYEKMTDAQRESAMTTIRARQAEIEDEIARLKNLRDLQQEVANFTASERASLAKTLGISEDELQGSANAATATQAAIDGLAQRSAALDEKLQDIANSGKASAEAIKDTGSAATSSADDFLKVADAIGLQILELSAGAEAAERYQLIQRVGRDLTEDEINQLDSLLAARQRLRAEREAEIAAERLGEQARRLGFELELEIGGEAARIEDQMFERLSIIDNALAAEAITKEEHRQLELQVEQAYQDELTRLDAEAEQQRTQLAMQEAQARRAATESMLAGLSGVFGNFAEIAKQGGEETFGTYKALASAQAAISAAVAINRALADGGPFLGPALAVSIAALTGAQIAAINKQQYNPRAVGGQVIGGNQYLVGERGPELITMGANGNVTPYNQLMREARGAQQAPQQNVRVIVENYGSEKATTSESVVNDERIIRVVVGNINARREIHSAITRTTSASNKVGA